MQAALLAILLALASGPAAAQAISGEAAAQQLFSTRGVQLLVSRSLSEEERAILRELVREADRTGQDFRYYGSIAYSPSDRMTGQSIQGAFDFHSTDAADRAALEGCRAAGGLGCEVAAHILPRGYVSGRTQVSHDATSAFRSTYRRVRGPKALAISPATGAWKIAEGGDTSGAPSTAVAACNRDALSLGGPADCTAVVAD